jgi:hypothetical protein
MLPNDRTSKRTLVAGARLGCQATLNGEIADSKTRYARSARRETRVLVWRRKRSYVVMKDVSPGLRDLPHAT